MPVIQSEGELKTHLKEQIDFLQRSAKAYDEGYTSEAKRIAMVLRILLHDTSSSTSLMTLLNKKKIKFYNTASTYCAGNLATMRLINIGMGVKDGKPFASYHAPLDNRPPTVNVNRKSDFDQWWNETVIIDLCKNEFSRKNLVLNVCNKDGGAHIDPELNQAYADLTRFNSLGWEFGNPDRKFSLTEPELANIRQICHEVLKTFKDEFPEYFV
ncbi:MAG: hypothetical protein WCE46_07930 [Methanoregula sp.]|uniref:hypothetical protein n=1 Tax=Methanoregula sp. TaxID=2052170 RepID=UPI003C76A77D